MIIPDAYVRKLSNEQTKLKHHIRVLADTFPIIKNTYQMSHIFRDIGNISELMATLLNHRHVLNTKNMELRNGDNTGNDTTDKA